MHALMHTEHLELDSAHVAFLVCLAISVFLAATFIPHIQTYGRCGLLKMRRVETYACFYKF